MSLSSVNSNAIAAYTDALNSYYDGTVSMLYAFVTNKNGDNDTYTYRQMLEQEDRDKFIDAMLSELDDHNQRGH